MIENFEKLLADHLRTVDLRVTAKTPDDTDSPWVCLTLLNAPQTDLADHFSGYYCQLDCYAGAGGGQPEAVSVAAAARGAIGAMEGVHDLGVVTGAQIEGFARIPDAEFEPARERIIVTATIYAHP